MVVETGTDAGRVHAYDAEKNQVPHPLGCRYELHRDWLQSERTPGPRCQHCLEIVGQYRYRTDFRHAHRPGYELPA